MATQTPLLSDIPVVHRKYALGDRVIARVYTELTPDQDRRLRRIVNRFSGADVNLLIVNVVTSGIMRVRARCPDLLIAKMEVVLNPQQMGILNLDLARVELLPDDALIVKVATAEHAEKTKAAIRRWAGIDVDVVVVVC